MLAIMDAKAITVEFVSKYVDLLDRLQSDKKSLASLKVSVQCSQRNQNIENELTNLENRCSNCLNLWKQGNFTVRTVTKRLHKRTKVPKKSPAQKKTFKMVLKCLICLNTTSSIFNKTKILKDKSTRNISQKSMFLQNINESPKVEEKNFNPISKKPKKKKRNLFAGLNPLVFKNNSLCKKKKKINN